MSRFDNSCAHLGMPLEMGEVKEGVITCSYHGFQYLLETGECLTAPEVQLKVHAVRVTGDRSGNNRVLIWRLSKELAA